MRKVATFETWVGRKRRAGGNAVRVDAIDEMSLKSAEASVVCKKPTGRADDER